MSSAFVATLSILAVILFFYKGKRPADFWLSTIASLFASFVIIFPTSNLGLKEKEILYRVTFIPEDDLHPTFHFISAGIFLICLAAVSFFRFPENDSSNEVTKPLDRFMYRACGIIIVIAILAIFFGHLGILLPKSLFENDAIGTFVGEAIAMWAFGYSWLLKAGFFTKFTHLFVKPVSKPAT